MPSLAELTAGAGDAGPLLAPPFLAMLTVSAWTDLRRRIVPDLAVAAGAAAALAIAAAVEPGSLDGRVFSAVAAGGFLLAAALARPGGLGLGDVKLGAAMGAFLGISIVPALLAAFAAGSAVAIPIVARHGVAARRRAIPFAPCLALGGILALVVGPSAIDWYLRSL
jgi:leader peptidase (prepilin peptidase)/N-methyltransferase